ncbi:hypothetical protein [Sporosalibacterium faouarense]|uniref:hypothetical protein n=1 Tax=Sporosalibacterium faouarense TaxID=516123 RepID=UPI00141C4D01|nr:hypothetical protein [Sporosalibacterium faouarense]MTI48490.1 hypothetical protein [Bacillota bacterium]
MDKRNLERVKKLYDKGFKCIRYEDGENGELTAYFKNFEEESIDSIQCIDKKEINEIKSFIDQY